MQRFIEWLIGIRISQEFLISKPNKSKVHGT